MAARMRPNLDSTQGVCSGFVLIYEHQAESKGRFEMTGPMEIPDFLYEIPEDATPFEKLYMRAQVVIQAAFHAFGDRDYLPDKATLSAHELLEVLAMSSAMLLTLDPSAKTKRDVRLKAEGLGHDIQKMALAIKETGDTNIQRMMDALRMTSSATN
jgi:hypothetical protein